VKLAGCLLHGSGKNYPTIPKGWNPFGILKTLGDWIKTYRLAGNKSLIP
jgi:hypothetical protein